MSVILSAMSEIVMDRVREIGFRVSVIGQKWVFKTTQYKTFSDLFVFSWTLAILTFGFTKISLNVSFSPYFFGIFDNFQRFEEASARSTFNIHQMHTRKMVQNEKSHVYILLKARVSGTIPDSSLFWRWRNRKTWSRFSIFKKNKAAVHVNLAFSFFKNRLLGFQYIEIKSTEWKNMSSICGLKNSWKFSESRIIFFFRENAST